MSKHFTLRIFATLAFLPWGLDDAAAARIIGGSAIFTLNEGLANSIGEFDAYFDDTKERDATLSDPAPGNAPFSETAANPGTIVLTDAVRPFGNVPSPYPGTPGQTRSRQVTTLDFDPADVLGSWEPSNDDYAFVGNSLLGEQIAFTGMQRWSGNFTGVLLYGDFALRYVFDGSSSRLLIASNIDFPHAAFAEVASPIITVSGSTLTISGELLTGGGLFVLDPSALPGSLLGSFALTASLTRPGDFNQDGIVDGSDFLVWQRDTTVGELDDWKANFGPNAASNATAAIPEPLSFPLSIAAIALLVSQHGRWRRRIK